MSAGEFRIVIPARYASTRLPGKALLLLVGKPMLQWVFERASASAAQEVIVATDDARIAEAARKFNAPVESTDTAHASGTDRIAEVARRRGWKSDAIVVNVQGDEPLIAPASIDQVAAVLEACPDAGIATLATPILSAEELQDPNVVKVVADPSGRALYFSRAPIPWNRDEPGNGAGARRHIGIYAYRVGALLHLAALPPGKLESVEKLEQLRALTCGIEIRVAEALGPVGQDVNTAEDLERVARLLAIQ